MGFLNVLEGVRRAGVRHLVYASSSSVYGASAKVPFSVADRTDAPVSLYAATKKANELMAHCYSHLYGIAATGLRFFTVYGPWGRPDMAPLRFAEAITQGRRLEVYNYGRMRRDFTYIDDAVEGVVRVARSEGCGARVFNVGYGRPIALLDFIQEMERALGLKARKKLLPAQSGDVPVTHADAEEFWRLVGYRPRTGIEAGVAKLIEWYREYYGVADSGQRTADSAEAASTVVA
jgi:UDP-glucuronate 4-epimerase